MLNFALFILGLIVVYMLLVKRFRAANPMSGDIEVGWSDGCELPDLDGKRDRALVAHSESDEGLTYQVNLYQRTCTCPDFRDRRARFPRLEAARLCKHLAYKLDERCGLDELGQPFYAVVRLVQQNRPLEYRTVDMPAGVAIVANKPGSEWVNVIAPYDWPEGAERFKNYWYGYSLIEHRWSYGRAPVDASYFVQLFGAWGLA